MIIDLPQKNPTGLVSMQLTFHCHYLSLPLLSTHFCPNKPQWRKKVSDCNPLTTLSTFLISFPSREQLQCLAPWLTLCHCVCYLTCLHFHCFFYVVLLRRLPKAWHYSKYRTSQPLAANLSTPTYIQNPLQYSKLISFFNTQVTQFLGEFHKSVFNLNIVPGVCFPSLYSKHYYINPLPPKITHNNWYQHCQQNLTCALMR